MSFIRISVNRSVAKAFQTIAVHINVEIGVHKCLYEPHVINDVTTRTIDEPEFTVPAAKYVKNEVEKSLPW